MNTRSTKRSYPESDISELSEESFKRLKITDDTISEVDSLQIEEELKETNPEAYSALIASREEGEKTEPNIIRILCADLLTIDRAKLVQFYEVYKNCTPYTEQWFEIREKFNDMFDRARLEYNHHANISSLDHKKMSDIEKTLEQKLQQTHISLKYRILNSDMSDHNRSIIYGKFRELEGMNTSSDEYAKLKTWIQWSLNLPHNSICVSLQAPQDLQSLQDLSIHSGQDRNITNFLKLVSTKLDSELYGMKSVKQAILLYLNARLHNPHMKRCVLGFTGPPGVGKTRISRLLSEVLQYPFAQIFCGGVNGVEFFKGHSYTYIGSQPGAIAKSLCSMKSRNGILFFDEFEKVSESSTICAELLRITDPEQNSDFRDDYFGDINIDLSQIWMIFSMNSPPLDKALRDRINIIHVPGYSHTEKREIVKTYILPKILRNIGLNPGDVRMSNKIIMALIERVCPSYDMGVRTIEKAIIDICNKIHFIVSHQSRNGGLKGFDVDFDIGKTIQYPVTITMDILDVIAKSDNYVEKYTERYEKRYTSNHTNISEYIS